MGGFIKKIVIVGAGIAGLSAANRLADKGNPPIVIDTQSFPQHRICGEFFSSDALPLLKQWDLKPSVQIKTCTFRKGTYTIPIPLPSPARGWSRYEFDTLLFKRASSLGVQFLTQTHVEGMEQKGGRWHMRLSNGTYLESDLLLIGTGRLTGVNSSPRYIGFKAHFEGISLNNHLEMICFNKGYIGISSVGPQTVNVACIASLQTASSPQEILNSEELRSLKERLDSGRMLFPDWLTTKVPEFGIRRAPNLPNVLWIGDAAGSIPPISGYGLTIAIDSGILAADAVLSGNPGAFQGEWLRRFGPCFRHAKAIHTFVMNPVLSKFLYPSCCLFPSLPRWLLSLIKARA